MVTIGGIVYRYRERERERVGLVFLLLLKDWLYKEVIRSNLFYIYLKTQNWIGVTGHQLLRGTNNLFRLVGYSSGPGRACIRDPGQRGQLRARSRGSSDKNDYIFQCEFISSRGGWGGCMLGLVRCRTRNTLFTIMVEFRLQFASAAVHFFRLLLLLLLSR